MQYTLLIIDENKANRQLLCTALRDGFDLLEAGSAKDAKALLLRGGISAVLFSVSSPAAGCELLQQLRADAATARLVMIALFAAADDEGARAMLSLGAADCVAPPYQWDTFKLRLRNLIRLGEAAASGAGDMAQDTRMHGAAAEAARARREFLSRMSHDLRTPMNAIIGMLALAKEEDNPPGTAVYLQNIEAASRFLLGLINDILDLGRTESEALRLSEEPFSLEEFISGIDATIRPLMDAKNIEFELRVCCGECSIMADKLRFHQIFFNLLSNAAKYTPDGGRVEFIAERIASQGDRHGLRFTVRDSGVGMSPAFLNVAFAPFSQEAGVTNELQGSGLGLAIVKNIVDAMGGDIRVTSALGEGTEFVVELHVKKAVPEETSARAQSIDKTALSGLRVLLAEDNTLNVMVAKKLLERAGCIVTVAKNGREALTMYERSAPYHFNAVLMDIRMPVMDGLEATRSIRALPREDAAAVPIIAMTADAFLNCNDQTLSAGMTAYLAKPVDPHLLYATIINLTAGCA